MTHRPNAISGVLLVLAALGAGPAFAGAPAGRVAALHAGRAAEPVTLALYASEAAPAPLLPAAETGGAAVRGGGRDVSPALAGLMSAVVPGSGQLALGSRRGWVYLGIETASWFGVWALRAAGHQAEDDFAIYADGHWGWQRYETVGSCGDGLGPTANFEEEKARLHDLYDTSRPDFYDDIGDLNIYACGWDDQASRATFNGMRDDANGLFRAARGFVTVAFLNHIVSAVDAAKTASNRREANGHAFDLRIEPGPRATPDVTLVLSRSF